jgi:hypothetical protein
MNFLSIVFADHRTRSPAEAIPRCNCSNRGLRRLDKDQLITKVEDSLGAGF